jgi:hypothetical protein
VLKKIRIPANSNSLRGVILDNVFGGIWEILFRVKITRVSLSREERWPGKVLECVS